jgi:hypothetical protein
MEAIAVILAFVAGLAVMGGASVTWGIDSREPYADDRRR